MTVYKLKNRPREYKVLEHDPYKRALDKGDVPLLRRLRRDPVESKGLQDIWVEEDTVFTQHFKSADKVPDISKWRTFLVLRDKAYQQLKAELQCDGEFLPIIIDGEKFQLLNVLSFGAEDKEQITFEVIDGEQGLLEKLVFDESSIANKYVFKSLDEGCMSLYCDDKLIELCSRYGLTGLRFDTDLLDVFED
ncbi:hypothetical protein [Vibrio rotiferianus]|uniref:hypothetical protein n=1 Tax=Vibrio rotiferianus TaxID=190895 RepID=UPI00390A8AE1